MGAYGGRRDLMDQVAPQGPVYQAGTLSGNPLAMAAGIATLKELSKPGFYDALEQTCQRLLEGMRQAAHKAGVAVSTDRVGSMLGLFFTPGPVRNFEDAKRSDLKRFAIYYQQMLARGIYLAPSQFEAFFVSAAHDASAVGKTLQAAEEVFGLLAA